MKKWIFWLRISLGIIFFWFGILKVFGYNPVFEIVNASFPFLAQGIGNIMLGGLEALIGLGLLFSFFPVIVHVALVGHLIGTGSVFFLAPELLFDPAFPFLSLSGEFVLKNITLLMAGFVVFEYWRHNHHR